MIQNLNQLKKSMTAGARFKIIRHIRPECVGQIRRVTLANTVGFYSHVDNDPENPLNRGNNGMGPVLWWGKAKSWEFAEGVCTLFEGGEAHSEEHRLLSIELMDEAA